MTKLRPCPCGKTPSRLAIVGDPGRYAFAAGDCCGEWYIEFRADWRPAHECDELAAQAWNDAQRESCGWED